MTNLISKKFKMIKRYWYKFSQNILSVLGLITILAVIFVAVFAPYIAPHKESAGNYINFNEANKPPSAEHIFGTDAFGRDVLSRIFFGLRISLILGIVVLSLSVPVGVIVGLIGGYHRDNWIGIFLMRIVDIFVAVPVLLLALVVCSMLSPSLFHAMIAISIAWWSWYARILYNVVSSIKGEFYIQAAQVIGASTFHILFKEILPNCLSTIFTKMSIDMASIILVGSSISFVGLGAQPPIPDLGTMVADGANLLPDIWWITLFPAITIVIIVLAFNLVGDGLSDMLGAEKV